MSFNQVRAAMPFVVVALLLAGPPSAGAQQDARDTADRRPNPSQPDFTLVNLPTTLRLPRHRSTFRITHRFTQPLNEGSFGELAESLFGLDSGALIGFEYRFGLMRGLQAGVMRTSDRTVQFFGQYSVLQQGERSPVGLGVLAAMDGTDNFRDHYTPAVGAVVSRELGTRGALYVEPMWVHNADPLAAAGGRRTNTLLVGLGARLRVSASVYMLGEFVPRAGHTPSMNQGSFGIEKRSGGHVFQLNVSNGVANTSGQLARGSARGRDWLLGFNISRKFFR